MVMAVAGLSLHLFCMSFSLIVKVSQYSEENQKLAQATWLNL